MYLTPNSRDEYFFDICREAGFDVTDPGDWAAMSTFARELKQIDFDENLLES